MKLLKTVAKVIGMVFIPFIGFVILNQLSSVSKESISNEKAQINERQGQSNSIVCILNADKRTYKVGEPPELSVRIINKLDTSVVIVGSLDGSDIGFRPPFSYFTVRHKMLGNPGSDAMFCPTVNPIRKEDFRIVESNQDFDPYERGNDHGYFGARQLEGRNFRIPGIYELTYVYSTGKNLKENRGEQIFDSTSDKELIDLWSKVPNVELTSNTITIEYNL